MSRLFGFTSFVPETTDIPEEQLKVGQGYNVLKKDHEQIYEETKTKFQELYQPIKKIDLTKDLNEFPVNDIGRTMHGTNRLNASYYSDLKDDVKEYPYGTQVFYPQSYPNHFYNVNKFSPLYLALK